MSTFSAGDTFLAASPRGTKLHLTIVLCDPSGNPPTILTVSLNTKSDFTDPTLILNVGDHPFIKRETAVSYDEMLCIEVDKLSELERMNDGRPDRDRTFIRHRRVSADLLNRIIDGAFKSDDIPKGMEKLIKERLAREA
jgi:hypothetical protein